MDSLLLHARAALSAQMAVDNALVEHGEGNRAFLYCGFAWVTIKQARSKFVKELKAAKIGTEGINGGWRISSNIMFSVPGTLAQSMELKEIGAAAYANVLTANGIDAMVGGRAD